MILTVEQTKIRTNTFSYFLLGNKVVDRNSGFLLQSEKNKVNLNAWIVPNGDVQNTGDYLSKIIVENMCSKFGLDIDQVTKETKHLYAIGSILMGYQDMTVWGSGFGCDKTLSLFFHIYKISHRIRHKVDIRAVRGPETRRILMKMGYNCPEVYGDPAILLPLFYPKELKESYDYTLIPHYSKNEKYRDNKNFLDSFNKDWKKFIDRIISSKLVISSSLHGIILAESYGVPAVMLKDTPSDDITKYKDWYYSTGRKSFPIASSVDEALNLQPSILEKNTLQKMQNGLIETFPRDLWM